MTIDILYKEGTTQKVIAKESGSNTLIERRREGKDVVESGSVQSTGITAPWRRL